MHASALGHFGLLAAIVTANIFPCGIAIGREARPLAGCSYGPFRFGQAPGGTYPTTNQIREDLVSLERVYRQIRTYGTESTLYDIPQICSELKLDCYPCAWIGPDSAGNAQQVTNLIQIAHAGYATTKGLVVGNEALLNGYQSKSNLISYIQTVSAATALPVTTAEPWNTWLDDDNADLVAAVDYIMVHIHPYWDGIAAGSAAVYVTNRWSQVRAKYPGKLVVVGETGWPTAGPARGNAVPGDLGQTTFLNALAPLADNVQMPYFVFEGFDVAWKLEDGVGPHWGCAYTNRVFKSALNALLARATPIQAVSVQGRNLHFRCGTFGGNPYRLVAVTNLLGSVWNQIMNCYGTAGTNATTMTLPMSENGFRYFRLEADY